MNRLLRKLRGVLGTGLTWAVGWALIMMTIGVFIGIVDPDSIDPGEGPLAIGAIVGIVGFFSGAAFGTLLSIAEHRKKILDLSLGRAALWGALAGAALPLLTGINDAVVFNTVPLGVLFSTATVAIARRAELRESDEPKLLDGRAVAQ